MIPYDSFSANVKHWLTLLEDNGFVSISSLKEYSIPRAEHRLDMLEQQKAANAQHFGNVQKIQRQIDSLDLALSEVHGLVNPSLVGSVHGGEAVEVSGTAELGLSPCRFRSCPELVDRSGRFFNGGFCRKCWNRLTETESTQEVHDHE